MKLLSSLDTCRKQQHGRVTSHSPGAAVLWGGDVGSSTSAEVLDRVALVDAMFPSPFAGSGRGRGRGLGGVGGLGVFTGMHGGEIGAHPATVEGSSNVASMPMLQPLHHV